MASFIRQLVTIDRGALDVRAGLAGLAVLTVFGVAVALAGPEAMAAAVGALVVLSADPPPAGRSWAASLGPLVVGGALLTFAAVAIGDRPGAASVLVGVVGVVAALHAGRSRRASVRGLVATVWIILALTLHDTGVTALEYAVTFTVGAAAGAVAARSRARRGDSADMVADEDDQDLAATPVPTHGGFLGSPVVRFAVLRGVGLAAAVLLGFTLFPEHPAWIAITALIVMRPPTRQALVIGLQRSLGTGIGVVAAVALAEAVGQNEPALVLLFLASAFLMMAFREVNYALFATLVTALVVYLQRILGADAAESGRARLLETLLGVAIAFVVLGLADAVTRTTSPAAA